VAGLLWSELGDGCLTLTFDRPGDANHLTLAHPDGTTLKPPTIQGVEAQVRAMLAEYDLDRSPAAAGSRS